MYQMLDLVFNDRALVHPNAHHRRVRLAIEPKKAEVLSANLHSNEPVMPKEGPGDRITHSGDPSEWLKVLVQLKAEEKPSIDPRAQVLASKFLKLPVLDKTVTKLKNGETNLEYIRYTLNHYLSPPSESFIKLKLLEHLLYSRMSRLFFDEIPIESKTAETVKEQDHNINALLNTLDSDQVNRSIQKVMTTVGGRWDPPENWPPVRDHLSGLEAYVKDDENSANYSNASLEAQARGKQMLT
jgi:hypothetical protein